jgi:protein-tyrosine phosphatase
MMVDFHSHILPGIDDGSDCVDTSLKMLALEKAQGITHVVATPHFYPNRDNPAAFLARRAKAMEALAARMTPELPQVIPGAEVAFFRGMSQSEALVDLTLGKSKFLLVELPPAPWPEEARVLTDPRMLSSMKAFRNGYTFSEEHSDETTYVFLKNGSV